MTGKDWHAALRDAATRAREREAAKDTRPKRGTRVVCDKGAGVIHGPDPTNSARVMVNVNGRLYSVHALLTFPDEHGS